jgi:hypothetical protein
MARPALPDLDDASYLRACLRARDAQLAAMQKHARRLALTIRRLRRSLAGESAP